MSSQFIAMLGFLSMSLAAPPSSDPARSFSELMDIMRGFQESRVLLTAVELDLFTAVGTGATAGQVSRKLGTNRPLPLAAKPEPTVSRHRPPHSLLHHLAHLEQHPLSLRLQPNDTTTCYSLLLQSEPTRRKSRYSGHYRVSIWCPWLPQRPADERNSWKSTPPSPR